MDSEKRSNRNRNKIARILHCLKNKPESEQRAMINKIRIEGIDKAFKWL